MCNMTLPYLKKTFNAYFVVEPCVIMMVFVLSRSSLPFILVINCLLYSNAAGNYNSQLM